MTGTIYLNFGGDGDHEADIGIFTLRASCGAVYCNLSRLCVWGGYVCYHVTRNCVHRSSPNWVCK